MIIDTKVLIKIANEIQQCIKVILYHEKMGIFLKNARMVQHLKINQQLMSTSIHGIKANNQKNLSQTKHRN